MTFKLILEGRLPSKKNAWRRSASGGVYLPGKQQHEIDAMTADIVRQRNAQRLWEPFEGDICVIIRIPKGKADLDNQATTILDMLQKARIIKNDGMIWRLDAEFTREKKITVEVSHFESQ